jgi:hypothetical protein
MGQKSIVLMVSNDLVTDRRISRIGQSLSVSGYDVTLVGRVRPDSMPLARQRYEQVRLRCLFNKGWLFYAELNIRLVGYLLTRKFDIIVSVDYDTILAGAFGKRKSSKMVFDAHEWFEEVPEVIFRPFVKSVWKYIASVSIRRSALRYTVSEGLATNLQNLYSLPFEVIHNYPFLGDLKFPESIREDIVVYIGVLNKGRGLEQAVLAMERIDAVLWIVGEGDLSLSLRLLVSENRLEEKVFFKGWCAPEGIRDILSRARIGLNLLDPESPSYYYSLANKFFDYVHASLPALNMRFPEYTRYNEIHEVSILHDDLNEERIVDSIQILLNNSNLWDRLHQNCKVAARSWCWEKESVRLITLFDRL